MSKIYFKKNRSDWGTPKVYFYTNSITNYGNYVPYYNPVDNVRYIDYNSNYRFIEGTNVISANNAIPMNQSSTDKDLYYIDLPLYNKYRNIMFLSGNIDYKSMEFRTESIIPIGNLVSTPICYYQSPIKHDKFNMPNGSWIKLGSDTITVYLKYMLGNYDIIADNMKLSRRPLGYLENNYNNSRDPSQRRANYNTKIHKYYEYIIPLDTKEITIRNNDTNFIIKTYSLSDILYNIPMISINKDIVEVSDAYKDEYFRFCTQYNNTEYQLYYDMIDYLNGWSHASHLNNYSGMEEKGIIKEIPVYRNKDTIRANPDTNYQVGYVTGNYTVFRFCNDRFVLCDYILDIYNECNNYCTVDSILPYQPVDPDYHINDNYHINGYMFTGFGCDRKEIKLTYIYSNFNDFNYHDTKDIASGTIYKLPLGNILIDLNNLRPSTAVSVSGLFRFQLAYRMMWSNDYGKLH